MADQSQSSVSLRQYAEILWRRKLIVIAFTIIVPALTFGLSLQQAPQYDATARVIVESQATAFNAAAGQNLGDKAPDDRQVATLASFVVTQEVAQRVNALLGWAAPINELIAAVEATPDANANVIEVTATQPRAAKAAELANAFAGQFVEWRKAAQLKTLDAALEVIDRQIASAQSGTANHIDLTTRRSQLSVLKALTTGGVAVGEQAQVPDIPSRPTPIRNALLAAVAGLVVGLAAAFLRESLDIRLRTVEDIQQATDLPLLGTIEDLPKQYQTSTKLVALDDPRGSVAESFRLLRTNLNFANFNHDMKAVMITSPVPSQGKTTTVANLAVSLLRAEKRVAVLEGDLRRPALQQYFNVPNVRGLTTVVSGATTFQAAAHRLTFKDSDSTVSLQDGPIPTAMDEARGVTVPTPALDLLTSGPIPPNPGEIVASRQFRELIVSLSQGRDYVLVDAPPMFAVGDATTLAGVVDGIIVVLRFGETTRQVLREVEEFLARVPARSLGVVVAGAPRSGRSSTYRYPPSEYGCLE